MADDPRIEAVAPLGSEDQALIEQLRQVLEDHGAVGRLGLILLHSHFDLGDDEVLVETVDAKARTLTISPRKKEELAREADPVETSWRLDPASGELECVLYCYRPKGSDIHEI